MKFIISIIIMSFITPALIAQEKISFKVSFSEPQAHYADVEMELGGMTAEYVDLKMPVWAPGSYLIREFAKNVEGFEAVDSSGKKLRSQKINKNTWRVYNSGATRFTAKYKVYAFEISVRTSFVDASHAFLSPTGIFMHPDGKIHSASTVAVIPFKGWEKISTGLEPVAGKQNVFIAPDFDILYDSPIEVGNQDIFYFEASGVKHEVAMAGGGNYDKAQLSRDMAAIVEAQTKMFGVNPNKRYVFIVHNYNAGGGGLEHLNSTVLGATRNAYSTEAGNVRFLSLVSHEYFHLWNVKRLRPIALGPFNYDEENYTTNLWIAEGFTAYYQDVFMQRTGLISPERYLNVLASNISGVENQPGVRIQPLSEASFDAWIKHYRPNENSANSTISYYSKGAMLGLIMDLEIINSTNGRSGLDDVMKAMYEEYYVKQGRGFTDAEFKAMVESVAGRSFDPIYDNYVNGLTSIDYAKYLSYAGLRMINEANPDQPFIGFTNMLRSGKTVVSNIVRNSPAWVAGINVNDEIIAIDGTSLKHEAIQGSTEIDRYLTFRKAGDKMRIDILRDNLPQTIELNVGKNPSVKYRIVLDEKASKSQIRVRDRWLKKS